MRSGTLHSLTLAILTVGLTPCCSSSYGHAWVVPIQLGDDTVYVKRQEWFRTSQVSIGMNPDPCLLPNAASEFVTQYTGTPIAIRREAGRLLLPDTGFWHPPSRPSTRILLQRVTGTEMRDIKDDPAEHGYFLVDLTSNETRCSFE